MGPPFGVFTSTFIALMASFRGLLSFWKAWGLGLGSRSVQFPPSY